MSDVWEKAPEDLEVRIGTYAKKAKTLKIPEDRVAQYARILIAAEEVVAARLRDEQRIRDETVLGAAAMHGFSGRDPEKARVAYARARKAQAELHNSAGGLVKRLATFERLLNEHHETLYFDVANRFPSNLLIGAIQLLREFAASISDFHNFAEIKIARSELSLTIPGHTFMWWRKLIPRYPGQWSDMYALAQCWRLTDATCIDTFQRTVRKLKPERDSQGRTFILGCPPWALL